MKNKITAILLIFFVLGYSLKTVQAQSKTAADKPAKPVKPMPDKLLNGKTYIIVLEEPHGRKKPKLINDEIVFKSIKLSSTHFKEEHYFIPGYYVANIDTSYEEPEEPEEVEEEESTDEEDSTKVKPAPKAPAEKAAPKQIISVLFESNALNDLKDELRWTGQVIGDSINGSAFYKVKKQKTEVEYPFKGYLKPKPGKKPASK